MQQQLMQLLAPDIDKYRAMAAEFETALGKMQEFNAIPPLTKKQHDLISDAIVFLKNRDRDAEADAISALLKLQKAPE